MRKAKPFAEYQQGIYGEILGEFFNPIFSTGILKTKKAGISRFFVFKRLTISYETR